MSVALPASPYVRSIVVMGVAGSGKSTVAQEVAARLGMPLIEGDDFHSTENLQKMRQGIPLTDADREGWLDALANELRHARHGAVLACSALKRGYRDRLRAAVSGLRFVYLRIDEPGALARVAARADRHLFPPSLVASQFAALEDPSAEPDVLALGADQPPSQLAALVVEWLTRKDAT